MKVGDKVICIDGSIPFAEVFRDFKFWPQEGEKYTIRGIQNSLDRGKGLHLEELKNPVIFIDALQGHVEPAYSAKRFRVLEPDEVLEMQFAERELVPA